MKDPKKRDFRYILTEDTYVVWLAGANRFLQLKEPAFFVFEAWAGGKDTHEIAGDCAMRYGLPPEEALRFTCEIIGETEKLYVIGHGAWSMEHGACEAKREGMEHGAWSMRSEAESRKAGEHGAWGMGHGAWSMEHGKFSLLVTRL